MKKLLIILIALLIPVFLYARGSKPSTVGTVTGAVTVTSGSVTAEIDSADTRKTVSIDNISYVIEDSLAITSITGNDSSSVTSTALGNVNGILRVGVMAGSAVDSVDLFFNFGNRTIQKYLYADTAQVKGSETAYIKATGLDMTASKIYWCILYDPDATQPINYIPTANRTVTVEVVQRGEGSGAIGYTIFISRQVN